MLETFWNFLLLPMRKNNDKFSICEENPQGCSFEIIDQLEGEERSSTDIDQHILLFCQKGHIRISSNLFNNEFLNTGEILFIPRGSDYHGIALSDSVIYMHCFTNGFCRMENCSLSFLYTHKHIKPNNGKGYFYSKLLACGQFSKLMDGVNGYIDDATHEPPLWKLKHKELIWLFVKYYSISELRYFFHPITDEQVPFKSLVLAHYRKAINTEDLAKMCGYGLYTFRRTFKNEFNVSPYYWLSEKRAELIRHRLSFPHISFNDIIDEFHFSSSAHFTTFCKKFLGSTPSELRKKYREMP